VEYRLDGELHCEEGPAVIYFDGKKEWWKHGKLHRENGPAIFYPNGKGEVWYFEGKLHRKNEPAIITSYKELVVKIQSVEILRENERFIEWIRIVRQILEKLYPDFVWPTE
jgi:phage pi2 protein 07